jgi:hypothetical protein
MKPYIETLNQGKDLERLTIIHWLESLDENENWLEKGNELQSIADALKEQLHKDR